jgi:hypothetical protein
MFIAGVLRPMFIGVLRPMFIGMLRQLFRTAGHKVRTQHGVTASAGQRRRDVEIRNYLCYQAGILSLVFNLSITQDRYCSSSHVQQNGLLSHPQDLNVPLRLAAHRRINSYRQQYADNQNISLCVCFITAGPITKLCAWGEEESGGHVL